MTYNEGCPTNTIAEFCAFWAHIKDCKMSMFGSSEIKEIESGWHLVKFEFGRLELINGGGWVDTKNVTHWTPCHGPVTLP